MRVLRAGYEAWSIYPKRGKIGEEKGRGFTNCDLFLDRWVIGLIGRKFKENGKFKGMGKGLNEIMGMPC